MAETWAEWQERLAEAERVALAELKRRLEAGEIGPGRYEVLVATDVMVP
jgi:hypothetical protein